MNSSKDNYYQILGVNRTASQQEIRKRYRELVRKHHPDVNPDKEASTQLLIRVLEAYRTLGNPSSRAEYDRRLEREAAPQSRINYPPPPPPRNQSAPSSGPRRRTTPGEFERLLSNARLAFLAGNLRDAATHCRRAIHLNSRSAAAHLVMGDICRGQGHMDEAMSEYTIAMQLDQYNPEIRQKMARLVQDEEQKARQAETPKAAKRTELLRIAEWSFGAAAILACLIYLGAYPGKPEWRDVKLISEWSMNMVIVLALVSAIMGFLMSLTGAVKRADDELIFSTLRVFHGGRRQSFGITVVLLSLIWFYLGLVVYFIITTGYDSISTSVLKAFGAALAAVALVSLIVPAAAGQLFLAGANISFAFVLFGWVVGDFFKPLA